MRRWIGITPLILALSIQLLGCDGPWPRLTLDGADEYFDTQDADEDGWPDCYKNFASPCDCNDTRDDINPDANERCDDQDNDCDGELDNGLPLDHFYQDLDGDGYGGTEYLGEDCSRELSGRANNSSDCDDTSRSINPAEEELCNGVDDNCDKETDEGFTHTTFYLDKDGDEFGDDACKTEGCTPQTDIDLPEECQPAGSWIPQGGDCNDDPVTGEDINPAAYECDANKDTNCDGIPPLDLDQDGYLGCEEEGNCALSCDKEFDCDDDDFTVYPGAAETCDGKDNDCDLKEDELDESITVYEDSDGDGYGSDDLPIISSSCPGEGDGESFKPGDCNDEVTSINPEAEEFCDDIDNNCDGVIDEGVDKHTLYPDNDGDGFGRNASNPILDCDEHKPGYSLSNTDCNDSNNTVYPDAPEVCQSGVDNNCDGIVGDDEDKDGYCKENTSPLLTDCCDRDPTRHPGAREDGCDGVDNDCDGNVDNELSTYYPDCDGDGWGDKVGTPLTVICAEEYATQDGCRYALFEYEGTDIDCDEFECQKSDCNDWEPNTHPFANELCDGLDNDCDPKSGDNCVSSIMLPPPPLEGALR